MEQILDQRLSQFIDKHCTEGEDKVSIHQEFKNYVYASYNKDKMCKILEGNLSSNMLNGIDKVLIVVLLETIKGGFI